MEDVKRYTLPLPKVLHDKVASLAKEHSRTQKEILQQCLTFGLMAMEVSKDPNADIIFRQKLEETGTDNKPLFEDEKVRFVW